MARGADPVRSRAVQHGERRAYAAQIARYLSGSIAPARRAPVTAPGLLPSANTERPYRPGLVKKPIHGGGAPSGETIRCRGRTKYFARPDARALGENCRATFCAHTEGHRHQFKRAPSLQDLSYRARIPRKPAPKRDNPSARRAPTRPPEAACHPPHCAPRRDGIHRPPRRSSWRSPHIPSRPARCTR